MYDLDKYLEEINLHSKSELAMPTIYSLLLEYKKEVDEYSKGAVICDIIPIVSEDDNRFKFKIYLKQKNNILKYYIGLIQFYSFTPLKITFWIPNNYFPKLRSNDTLTSVDTIKSQLKLLIEEQKVILDNLIELTNLQELTNITKNETVVES